MDYTQTTTDNEERQAELELAVAELAFWLDFAKWWRKKYCQQEEPRITELLAQAEKRYLLARSVAAAAGLTTGPGAPAGPDLPQSVD